MQIYRFSLIFHSISELNKEKQPDFANFSADDRRRIVKVGGKLLGGQKEFGELEGRISRSPSPKFLLSKT